VTADARGAGGTGDVIRRIKAGLSAEARAETGAQIRGTVEGILGDIAARGGAAVREHSQRFDRWSPPSFRLSDAEIADCVRIAWPGGAVVVNISSIAARTAMGSNVMYCASKAALDNMTQSLARALAPAVRVVSVSPGLVDTDFVKSLDPGWRDTQAARTALGRLAAPDEVAGAVIAAVRDLTFTTGCVLAVDGGRPLN
jgi:NAD(P)-dependent dehydrogenase (short-subunit alcohol dehydrogenase family)